MLELIAVIVATYLSTFLPLGDCYDNTSLGRQVVAEGGDQFPLNARLDAPYEDTKP